VPFPCPACGETVTANPEGWALRCRSCRRVIRSRVLDTTSGQSRAYEVEAVGLPETRRRIEVPWSPEEDTRLRRWLLWSTVITLGLVGVLLAAAWMATR
jgi:hypothetical protein